MRTRHDGRAMRLVFKTARIVVVLVVAAIAATGCARDRASSQETAVQAALLVSSADVAQVTAGRLEAGIPFSGELQPIETVEVEARFDGDVDRVLVRAGQAVRKGQPLAVFNARDIQDRLRAAEAQVAAAQAVLTAAENGERRAQKLFEAGAAAPRDLEAAQAQKAAARAGLDAALAARNNAREDAEKLELPSPIDGWVSQVFIDAGERTLTGNRLMELVDTRTLELSATVPSEVLGRISKGMPIRFRVDAFPQEVFTGEVDRVSPTTEPGTRQVRIYMRFPNPEGRLVGGLFATGRAIEHVRDEALTAPVAALRQEGSARVVYALRHGHGVRIPVELGIVDEGAGRVELIGQIALGDSLLTGVLPGLRDGARVRVIPAGRSTNGSTE
ncbi:MAG: efflux RND transporter periplasmic adaptor subunit [Candidatus Eisenbacteria bacterium]|nr:efflux RND transporter periplasmic adaptor subunit [Candidatus Eisenbacteria bacterium]